MFKFMAKTKTQKQKTIKDLKEKIAAQKASVFIDFSGVDSKTLFKLRGALKKEEGCLMVVKKTLLRKVLDALGEEELTKKVDEVEGQLAVAFGFSDEIAPSRICYNAQKENENIKILGGILGKEYQSGDRVLALAQLPSKQELLARLVGSLASPVSRVVYVLKGNLSNLVCALSEIQKVK